MRMPMNIHSELMPLQEVDRLPSNTCRTAIKPVAEANLTKPKASTLAVVLVLGFGVPVLQLVDVLPHVKQ